MKAQILKIAGVKSEKEFYQKFPSEEAFMNVHGKAFQKAMLGAKLTTAQRGWIGLPDDPPVQNADPTTFNLMGDPSIPRQYEPIPMMGNSAQRGGPSTVSLLPSQQPKLASNNHPMPGIDWKGQLAKNADLPGKIMEGVSAIREEKELLRKTNQWNQVSQIALKASASKDVDADRIVADSLDDKRDIAMSPITGEEIYPIYGTKTNPLSRNGRTIKGRKSKGEIMNVGSLKMPIAANGFSSFLNAGGSDMIGNATATLYGDNAGSKLGGNLGGAVGGLFGPIGSMVGSEVGKLAGWAFDRNPAKTAKLQGQLDQNNMNMVFNNGMKGSQQQYTSYMEDGGQINNNWQPQVLNRFGNNTLAALLKPDPIMNTLRTGGNIRQNSTMQGDLHTHWGGRAEPVSYNPYLPDGGETVEFMGNSHEQSDGNNKTGIGITFGKSPVEVEGGEPAVKLANGGSTSSLTVFGNMPIKKEFATILGDPDATNVKFKNYIKDLADKTTKVNKLDEQSVSKAADLKVNTSFDKLTIASLNANHIGSQMKLKDYATKTENAAHLQDAINTTADEHGLVADELAKGNIKMAKQGTKLPPLTVGEPERKSWDIPGRVADWAGEKLGEAYQEHVPQDWKDAIEPVGEFMNKVSNWPFSPEYREEHPVNYGVAPGVGIAGKAAKVAKTISKADKLAQEAKSAAELATSIKREKFIQKAIKDITPDNINDPKIIERVKNLPQDHIEVLNEKLLEIQSKARKPLNIKTIEEAEAKAYPKSKRVSTKSNTSNDVLETVGDTGELNWKWPALGIAGIAGGIGYGINSEYNKTKPVTQPMPSIETPRTMEQLNRINPAAEGTSQMNPLYKAMQKNYEHGGNVAQNGWQEPWKTTPVYLPWTPQNEFKMQGVTPAGKMTEAQIAEVSKRYRPQPSNYKDSRFITEADIPANYSVNDDVDFSTFAPADITKPRYYANNDENNTSTDQQQIPPWVSALNSMIPYFRPSDAEELDSRQLAGEMYAMSSNQLEPVQAQSYQPRLKVPYDISFQDQLNEIHAQTRAAQKQIGYNPAAQAAIAAQAYGPESKVLADQFRVNQAMKDQVYGQNLQTLNDAQLKNLGIFDQQYQRQEAAKSNTKATNIEALKSISDKYLKNQSEQRTLQTMENLYGYRFGPHMQAINWNAPAQFNIPTVGLDARSTASGIVKNANGEELLPIYGKDGQPTGYRVKDDTTHTKTKKSGNGTIVRDWKSF